MFELLPILIFFFFILFIFNPIFWLIFFPIFLIAFFYFLSFELLLFAIFNLIVVPQQLWHMFKNPILRKNHALEHATINVLEERYGKLPTTGGLADLKGFHIFTREPMLTPEVVLDAAQEGLVRLQRGEKELAIHERCGTSITITNLILSIIFLLILFFGGMFDFWHVVIMLAIAFAISKPLGKLAQKYITTDPDVRNLMITGIFLSPFTKYFGIPLPAGPIRYFVETKQIPRAERIQ